MTPEPKPAVVTEDHAKALAEAEYHLQRGEVQEALQLIADAEARAKSAELAFAMKEHEARVKAEDECNKLRARIEQMQRDEKEHAEKFPVHLSAKAHADDVNEMRQRREEVKRLSAVAEDAAEKISVLRYLLRQTLAALPEKRDWLDPFIEKMMRMAEKDHPVMRELIAERDHLRAEVKRLTGVAFDKDGTPWKTICESWSAKYDAAERQMRENAERAERAEADAKNYWETLCRTVEALGKAAPEAAPYADQWAKERMAEAQSLRDQLRSTAQAAISEIEKRTHAEAELAATKRGHGELGRYEQLRLKNAELTKQVINQPNTQ